MTLISSYHEAVIDGNMTPKQYYDQWETEMPVEGSKYLVNKGTWMEKVVTIVHVSNGVALGISEKTSYGSVSKELYNSDGVNFGWKHNDPRPSFRLQKYDK